MAPARRPGSRRRARSSRGWRPAGVAVAVMTTVIIFGAGQEGVNPWSDDPATPSADRTNEPLARKPVPRAPAINTEAPPSEPTPTGRNPRPFADPSDSISRSGPGTFQVARISDPVTGETGHEPLTYTVEVEDELPFRLPQTARTIDRILADERGWANIVQRSFRRVSNGAEARILLATPSTTDRLCAPLKTRGRVSCRNGELVVLNARRWARATVSYRDDIPSYRTYLVNHEVGHLLGRGHVECPAKGLPAPVMQQQTYGLDGCIRNVWPSLD